VIRGQISHRRDRPPARGPADLTAHFTADNYMPMHNELISRIKRSYRLALESSRAPTGQLWSNIDKMRANVHGALLAESDVPLREIFSDPANTDLFYGVDNMSKSVIDPAKLDEYQNGLSALGKSDYFDALSCSHRIRGTRYGSRLNSARYKTKTEHRISYTIIDLPLG